MKSKYYAINNEYQANSLNWLGFSYMKFDDNKYGKIYSFENTDKFQEALKDLSRLRKKYNK